MKISLVRISTKDLAALTQRTIEASKNGKNRVSEPNPLRVQHQPQWNALYLEISELVKVVRK